jgi:hypothetical protein
MAKELKNWNTESRTNLNLYDSKSYYYITTSNRGRIQNNAQPSGNSSIQIDRFDDHQFHGRFGKYK